MKRYLSPAKNRILFIIVTAIMFISSIQVASSNASAEIPHENYDLISSDLDVIISLLNSSIRASENAFMSMYNESMTEVDQYLKVVTGTIEPAGKLLDKVLGLADSFKNLSSLLPPFVSLSGYESRFAEYEIEFLQVRTVLSGYGVISNLTDENLTGALRDVARAHSLMEQMNSTIDYMLIYAEDIDDLSINESHPFVPNYLVELIEKLRDLLMLFELQIEQIVNNEIPWGETFPFLLLWIQDSELYLGDTLRGGGYLYYNGSFQNNKQVTIQIDGNDSIFPTTTFGGQYGFQFYIPIDASYIGSHTVQSFAFTGYENLISNLIVFNVSLIPTKMVLTVDRKLLSPEDDLRINITLEDVFGRTIGIGNCTLYRDSNEMDFMTDSEGQYSMLWESSDIGLGKHTVFASYEGLIPFAPCDSNSVMITVNIPTSIELQLFESRFLRGFYVVGNGTLLANESEPLADQIITLIIDDEQTVNVTTEQDGSFAFSIESVNMTVGVHTLGAAFLYKDSIWRYSETKVLFTIFVQQRLLPYPFFPYIPGWGGVGGISDLINVFFGEYAYLTWLLMIIVLAVIIKSWQIRKRRKEKPVSGSSEIFAPVTETAEYIAPESAEGAGALRMKPPENPTARIIWYYNMLIKNLVSKRRVSIVASMTHWEVARLLRSLGYPFGEIEGLTMLFERAFYAGSTMSESDAERMISSVDKIESFGQEGSSDAV